MCTEPACTYAATRSRDLRRHQNRKHKTIMVAESESDTEDDSLPASQLTSTPAKDRPATSLEDNSMVRKPTQPLPVFSGRKRALVEKLSESIKTPTPLKVPRTTATAVRPTTSPSPTPSTDGSSPLLFASPTARTVVTNTTRTTPSLLMPVRRAQRTVATQTPWVMEVSNNVVVHHHIRRRVKTYYEEGAQITETTEESWED